MMDCENLVVVVIVFVYVGWFFLVIIMGLYFIFIVSVCVMGSMVVGVVMVVKFVCSCWRLIEVLVNVIVG